MTGLWRHKLCARPGCEHIACSGIWCQGHDPDLYHVTYLPAAPLVELVEARGGVSACSTDAALRRAYGRAKEAGELTEIQADRLSLLLLHRHPWELWDQWFSDDASGESRDLTQVSGSVSYPQSVTPLSGGYPHAGVGAIDV